MALNACFDRLKPLLQCAQSPNLDLTSYSSRRVLLPANVIAEITGEYVRGVTLYVFYANFVLYLLIIRAFTTDTPWIHSR